MINLDNLINKNIFHGICEIGIIHSIPTALPEGTKFTGEISVSKTHGILTIYIPYVAERDRAMRNFDFMVVKGGGEFVLPHNYQYIGHALIPHNDGERFEFINVYVEKEL